MARLRMRERLDLLINGANSVAEQLKRQAIKGRMKRKQKTSAKLEKLLRFKQREGME
jgi:hypothetical protein